MQISYYYNGNIIMPLINSRLPYFTIFGGVSALTTPQFHSVNGEKFVNLYIRFYCCFSLFDPSTRFDIWINRFCHEFNLPTTINFDIRFRICPLITKISHFRILKPILGLGR